MLKNSIVFIFFILFHNCFAQQIVDITYPVTNGSVYAIEKFGDNIYLGGDFDYIGPNTGSAIIMDSLNNLIQTGLRVDGDVYVSVPDNRGGYYLGGLFFKVNNINRSGVVHVDSTGTLSNWDPQVNGTVNSIIINQGVIYIGGSFQTVGGVSHPNIVAIDSLSGLPLSWNPNINGVVESMAYSNGRIYVAGGFSTFDGISRSRLAAFYTSNFLVSTWNPNPNNLVKKIDVRGDRVYACGSFFGIGGGVRIALAELDTLIGNITTFNASLNTGSRVDHFLVLNNSIYIAGNFTTVKGLSRPTLAEVNLTTGYPTSWIPNPDGSISMISQDDANVVIAGSFKKISGQAKRCIVFIDSTSKNILPNIDIRVGHPILQYSNINGKKIIAGKFSSIGGEFRSSVASFNSNNKTITSFNPSIKSNTQNAILNVIGFFDNKIYVGGVFDSINGQYSKYFGCIDTTGMVLYNMPIFPNNSVQKFVKYGNSLFFSGSFSSINGQNISGIAQLDLLTNQLTSTAINVNGSVIDMELNNDVLYFAGDFTSVNGVSRSYLASFNLLNNSLTSWAHIISGSGVNSIEFSSEKIFIAGEFLFINGMARGNMAAFDLLTGQLLTWNPNTDGYVLPRMKYIAPILYVPQGNYYTINNTHVAGCAALDENSGQATLWGNPPPNEHVHNYVFCFQSFDTTNLFIGTHGDGGWAYFSNEVGGFAVVSKAKPLTHYLNGITYLDTLVNCQDDSERRWINQLINLMPGNNYFQADLNGEFKIGINDSINYSIQPIIPQYLSNMINSYCPTGYSGYSTVLFPRDTFGLDFGFQAEECPILKVNITHSRMRRCMRGTGTISFSNIGLKMQVGVDLHVKFPKHITLLSADRPYTFDLTDSSFVFNVDTLLVNDYGEISIVDSIECSDSVASRTVCIDAWMTPSNVCYNNLDTSLVNWDSSSVNVSGRCIPNSGIIEFKIKNVGQAMSSNSTYRIYSDHVLKYSSLYQLAGNDSIMIYDTTFGHTIRLETDQAAGHPGNKHPFLSIEGCRQNPNDPFSTGFVNCFGENDEELEFETYCGQILDSRDPNTKNVVPAGLGLNHIVPPVTLLEYNIQFQNTGNDTAYRVVVVDTLSSLLDISTLELGASSHSYTYSVSGSGTPILTFVFNNINLVDSLTDELGSIGNFNFKIAPYPSVPIGSRIENSVAIYFDFDDAVLTNTAWVTIDTINIVAQNSLSIIDTLPHVSSACIGDTIFIAYNVIGAPATYQWYRGGLPIIGGTDSVLVISPLSHSDTSFFYCVISGLANQIITDSFKLDVINPVLITYSSSDTVVCPDASFSFLISAQGDSLMYQWFFNDTLLLNDTFASITFSNLFLYNAGNYYCQVSNQCNSVFSDSINLVIDTVSFPFVYQIGDSLFCSGAYAGYQWYKDSVLIPTATDSYFITNESGNYYLVVTNSNGCLSNSNEIEVLTSLDFLPVQKGVQISPNPFIDGTTIKSLSGSFIETIRIFGLDGMEVFKLNLNNKCTSLYIELNELQPSLYFVEVKTEKALFIGKLIKSN